MRAKPHRYCALLADAGGTLIPDRLPEAPEVRQVRVRRLSELFPQLDQDGAGRLLDDLRADAHHARDDLAQATDALIARRLAALDPSLAARAGEVRRALGQPTGHEPPPFPGHRDLLLAAGQLGLRRVLVSNTNWVSEDDWRRWRMPQYCIEGLLDGVVTSYSLGRRKPDRAMFERAMEVAGCPPAACVFIGDKEDKDVEPALALGMTVLRVAIEEPASPTRAHHLVTSLAGAIEVLRRLTNA